MFLSNGLALRTIPLLGVRYPVRSDGIYRVWSLTETVALAAVSDPNSTLGETVRDATGGAQQLARTGPGTYGRTLDRARGGGAGCSDEQEGDGLGEPGDRRKQQLTGTPSACRT